MRLFSRRKTDTTLYVVYTRPRELTDFKEYSKVFVRALNEDEAMKSLMDNKAYKPVAVVSLGENK